MLERLTNRFTMQIDHGTFKKDSSVVRRRYLLIEKRSGLAGFGSLSLLVPTTPGAVEVENFNVASTERGRGLGSLLLRTAFAELRDETHHLLYSDEVSLSALFARRKVFGEENMQFYTGDDYNKILPETTFSDAVARAAYSEFTAPPEGFNPGVYSKPPKDISPYGSVIQITT